MLAPKGKGAFAGESGNVSWAVLIGGGSAGELSSDGYLAVAAHNKETKTTELMRFGGSELSYKGTSVKGTKEDAFGTIEGGKLKSTVETK